MKPAPLAHIPSLGPTRLGALIVIGTPHLDLEKLHLTLSVLKMLLSTSVNNEQD